MTKPDSSPKFSQRYNVPKRAIKVMEVCQELLKQKKVEEAVAIYRNIIKEYPNIIPVILNLAACIDMLGSNEDVEPLYKRALEIDPNDNHVHFYYALYLLSKGRLREGFKEYRWRFKMSKASAMANLFPIPYWKGENVRGRHILVWSEQGIGDEIMLAGMLPDLLEQEAKITFVCSKQISSLMKRSFPSIDIIEQGSNVSKDHFSTVDWQASLTELGEYLRPTLDSFPNRSGYLVTSEQYAQRFKGSDAPFRIGISWRSTNQVANDDKSIPIKLWEPIFDIKNCVFVCLQHGDFDEELKEITRGTDIQTEYPDRTTVDKLANAVASCDLVVSVSNTNVHIAGALGKPVINIVPKGRGRIWYWFRDISMSPLYSSMLIIRRGRVKDSDLIKFLRAYIRLNFLKGI